MEFRQLEYILKIAEERNISRAAEKTFITQPALNQKLLTLEKELGTRLFHRSRNGCIPTEAGEIYLEGAREILRIRQNTYDRINDLVTSKNGQISIGFTPGRGIDMFVNVYPLFHEKYPSILVEPHEMSVRKLQQEIALDRMDVAFLTLIDEQKTRDEYYLLGKEELYLVVPETHALAGMASDCAIGAPEISLKEFEEDNFVLLYRESTMRAIVDQLFAENGFSPQILFDTSRNQAVLSMVESGLSCGIVPEYCVKKPQPGIRCFSIQNHPTWEISACYRKDRYLSTPMLDFMNLARDYWNL